MSRSTFDLTPRSADKVDSGHTKKADDLQKHEFVQLRHVCPGLRVLRGQKADLTRSQERPALRRDPKLRPRRRAGPRTAETPRLSLRVQRLSASSTVTRLGRRNVCPGDFGSVEGAQARDLRRRPRHVSRWRDICGTRGPGSRLRLPGVEAAARLAAAAWAPRWCQERHPCQP
jgi:hypothetical protein